MFAVFPLLGEALCPTGWGESLMRRHFRDALDAVLLEAYRQRRAGLTARISSASKRCPEPPRRAACGDLGLARQLARR